MSPRPSRWSPQYFIILGEDPSEDDYMLGYVLNGQYIVAFHWNSQMGQTAQPLEDFLSKGEY